ncbi:hypothetical protein, partial [Salmonella enterica]|uniref:hypothetical protein n=1 Tax=Salmonella enterica TaxID=28901 RepID=UPI0019552422
QSYDVPYVKLYLGNPKRPLRPVDENELKKVSLAYLLPFQASSFVNFASQAIIHSSQQFTVFSAYPAKICFFPFLRSENSFKRITCSRQQEGFTLI